MQGLALCFPGKARLYACTDWNLVSGLVLLRLSIIGTRPDATVIRRFSETVLSRASESDNRRGGGGKRELRV